MAQRLQLRRVLMLAVLLMLAFAGLGYRLVDLQVLRHDELSALAVRNTQREYLLEPRRGDILDARRNLLATSIFVKTVCADPVLIGNHQAEIAHALAPLLQLNETDLYQRLLPRVRQDEQGRAITNRYVVLKRKVTQETWDHIQETMKHLRLAVNEKKMSRAERTFYYYLRRKAIFTDPLDDQLRVYPNRTLAAHVLGFVGTRECEVKGKPLLETVGRDGIELTFNSKLAGVRGWRVTETDRHRHEVVPFREQDVEPRDGYNVVLTIDSVLQHILETALAQGMKEHTPVSITGVIIRPKTGEILAMATLPTFDPNDPGAAPTAARRDRMITDIMEPGSTFKIVTVSGALNEGVVSLNDTFDCEHGRFFYAGRTLHDAEPYGVLTVEDILTKSSNIGAAKIGIRLGEKRLARYIHDYGFGHKTSIPLPGEVNGIVHPVRHWSKISIARIPMGQGIAVTRLQMAMAMSAIANGGMLMRPMLVKSLQDRNGNVVAQYYPQPVRQVISQATDKLMVQALKTVVSPEGTAENAALEHFTVAGKTGTAQIAGPGGYLPHKYVASFVGFLPANHPQICISIVLDRPKEGYYGGQVAAPIFKKVAEQAANYLNIPPDKDLQRSSPPGAYADNGDFSGPVKTTSARTQTKP